MIINVTSQQSALAVSVRQTQRIARYVVRAEGQTCNELNVYFVDTPTLCALHEQFFQDPSPTDCISFPIDDPEDDGAGCHYRILGEVFICPATALAYAQEHGVDPYAETTLYLVHGILHLLGYDDLQESDEQLMRQREHHHMQELRSRHWILKPLIGA